MFAAVSASWLHPLLVAQQGMTKRTANRRTAGATWAVRSVLAGGADFSLAELYAALNGRWMRNELGAVLTKLQAKGWVEVIPAVPGIRGRRYKWKGPAHG